MSGRRTRAPASPAAFAVAAALALVLAGCGVKSAPKHPDGSTYPNDYPYTGDAKAKDEDQAKPAATPPPLGTQYDYPNRPPTR